MHPYLHNLQRPREKTRAGRNTHGSPSDHAWFVSRTHVYIYIYIYIYVYLL